MTLAREQIELPMLPLRDIVVFPHMIVPLFVGREKSVLALEEVMKNDKRILLFAQKNALEDDPIQKDIFTIGTIGTVLQMLKLPDGTVKVLVEGNSRVKLDHFIDNKDFLKASVTEIDDEPEEDNDNNEKELEALKRTLISQFESYVKLNKKVPGEILASIGQIDNISRLADTVASHLSIKLSEKQELLEVLLVSKRLDKIFSFIESELSMIKVEKKIRSRVKRQMEKTQREYYLNEQLKAIQRELGDSDEGKGELEEYSDILNKVKLPKEAKSKAETEIKKLKSMSPMSAESTVVRNYLDWLLGIPWKKTSRVKTDLSFAQKVLDADHFGLEKVKERIIEYLAVQKRTKRFRGPILCLVGAPGVGKTSLGKSIARATGRKFVRISLGGVRDESEIRGHRRTYIGSMPGKIIQGMKKAGTCNPLFLLDEVDKLGSDWRGDPTSALLEVLDPEQNVAFNDHYLEVDYDLSNVLFITTANTLRMPQPLLDRLEVIRLSGYTEQEKLEIAKRHLIDRQIERNGLKDKEWGIEDSAIVDLIRYYTREVGVRNLEREIAKLCRKATTQIVGGEKSKIKVTSKNIGNYSGVRKFKYGQLEYKQIVGVSTGLAYTETGGDILSIESVVMPGKGRRQVTGHLGDVMKESVHAAVSYVRSRSPSYGIEPPIFESRDIHVHVPEGATPKDGPSAGVAIFCSIVSILTGIPLRGDVAMTGEITLRGRVLAIGGLKEKLLAALRSNIKTVLIPQENEKDLVDIPKTVKNNLSIKFVESADEALKYALTKEPSAIEWIDSQDRDLRTPKDQEKNEKIVTH